MQVDQNYLRVLPSSQRLLLIINGQTVKDYPVSTARNGLGEEINSGKTPRGLHIIRAKIGADQPLNTVFVGRRPTGEIYSKELAEQYLNRDWVLTRIMWLSGLELGKNRLGNVDTMRRLIYIHGSPDDYIGQPLSKGCIRMHCKDIIELFDFIKVGTKIYIEDLII